jgi:hypothetical protein
MLTDAEVVAIVLKLLRAEFKTERAAAIAAGRTAADDDVLFLAWLATPDALPSPADVAIIEYWRAKDLAREGGDLEPLRKIAAARMGDPDFANCVVRPPQPKSVRRDAATPLEKESQRAKAAVIWHIRDLVTEVTGRKRGIETLVIEIAVELLHCADNAEVEQIIKHGPPRKPRAPKRR